MCVGECRFTWQQNIFYSQWRNSLTRVAVTGWVKPNPSVFDVLLADMIFDGKQTALRTRRENHSEQRVSACVDRRIPRDVFESRRYSSVGIDRLYRRRLLCPVAVFVLSFVSFLFVSCRFLPFRLPTTGNDDWWMSQNGDAIVGNKKKTVYIKRI